LKITRLETLVVGDGPDIDPNLGGVEPLAIIRVHTDRGLVGLSEAFRVPPGAVQATVGDASTHFGRLLIGQELSHPERIWQRCWDSMVHSNRRGWQVIVLGALDVACWDLYGQSLGKPIWQLLGGIQRNPFQTHGDTPIKEVVPYCTVVSDAWDSEAMIRQQVDRCERLAALGFRAFKVEPLMSTPTRVVELVRAVRDALGPGPALMVDVGYVFTDVATAAWVAQRLEPFDVAFLETPFPVENPLPYAELSRRTSIPLAMGEHGVTRWEFLDLMDRGNVQVVQPYMATCGGLTEAKRIGELAIERAAQVMPGNWSTQIIGTASAHFAAWSPVTPYIEYAPAEVYASPLRRVLQEAGLRVHHGAMSVPSRPGLGYDLPLEEVAPFRLDR
jgi:L-alanine-DL-glutamate epimerase-like enolase superfamily enzyme